MYVIHHMKFTLYCNKTEERRQKIETTSGLSDFEASAQILEPIRSQLSGKFLYHAGFILALSSYQL